MAFSIYPYNISHSAVRRYIVRAAILVLVLLVICRSQYLELSTPSRPASDRDPRAKDYMMLRKLDMTEKQCRQTFPTLLEEVDRSASRGEFKLERAVDDYMGLVQGRIEDGKLYIISYEKRPNRDMLFERTAVLHALHRAILTTPAAEPLPNTTFALTILDTPRNNTWSFARPNLPSLLAQGNHWLMPHFSSWSWPLPFIGPFDDALARIQTLETALPWEQKIEKVVWRGTPWFNSVGNRDLRPKLLERTRGKPWADVETLKWATNGAAAANGLPIEAFCRFKYVIYTEPEMPGGADDGGGKQGITYSGRLPFHQACNSVLITPPLTYQLHTSHLLRPVFSSALLRPNELREADPRWPRAYTAAEANVVFVDREWRDLEATVNWLRAHDGVARGIARRLRDGFVRKGLASEAAETCYWRGLVRGWGKVARVDEREWRDGGRGMRWETFSLMGKGE